MYTSWSLELGKFSNKNNLSFFPFSGALIELYLCMNVLEVLISLWSRGFKKNRCWIFMHIHFKPALVGPTSKHLTFGNQTGRYKDSKPQLCTPGYMEILVTRYLRIPRNPIFLSSLLCALMTIKKCTFLVPKRFREKNPSLHSECKAYNKSKKIIYIYTLSKVRVLS